VHLPWSVGSCIWYSEGWHCQGGWTVGTLPSLLFSVYQIQQANFKKIVIPPTCVWCIDCDSINRPSDLDLLTSKYGHGLLVWWVSIRPILGFLGLSVLQLGWGTRRQTAGRTDRQRPSFYNAPRMEVGGITTHLSLRRLTSKYVNSVGISRLRLYFYSYQMGVDTSWSARRPFV